MNDMHGANISHVKTLLKFLPGVGRLIRKSKRDKSILFVQFYTDCFFYSYVLTACLVQRYAEVNASLEKGILGRFLCFM